MSKYSVLVFDLGNVLIPFDYEPLIKKINIIQKGLGNKFAQFYKNNYEIHRNYERGKIKTEDFIIIMLKALDHKMTGEEFCKLFSSVFTVNQQVADLLPSLKKKYTLVLLSNTNYLHQKYGWKQYDFLQYFDKQILSFEAGAVKPERKIYKATEEFTQKPSAQHLYIDDIQEYVAAAKKLGWDGIHFTGYENLVAELQKRKIL